MTTTGTGEQNTGSSFSNEAASLYTVFCVYANEHLHTTFYNPASREFSPSKIEEIRDYEQLKTKLNTIGHKAQKKFLAVANKHFTIVPEGVFMPEHKDDYLSILFEPSEIESKKDIRFENASGIKNTRFIYAVEEELTNIAATYGYRIKHALPAHLAPVRQVPEVINENKTTGFIFLYEHFFYLALFQGTFLMCNTFPLITDADLGYYTLFAMEQFDLKGGETTIYHAGKSTNTRKKLEILDRYVEQLTPFAGLQLGFGSDQKPKEEQAENFILHSQLLCV